jgi:hypothetical protein
MRQHAFLLGLALVLSDGSLSHGAYAQQADKMPRVGVLINSPLTSGIYRHSSGASMTWDISKTRTSPL